jgi:hypothetical protein
VSIILPSHYYALHGEPSVQALKDNAVILLQRTNAVLEIAALDGVKPGIDQVSGNHVASGFRPAGVNAKTSNAATGSKHLTCEAIDIQDTLDGQRQLAVWCCRNKDVLERIGLWMEDPRWTAGRTNTDPWVHWQTRPASKLIYLPYADIVKHPPTDPDFYRRFALAA